jgi:hypothetical protein
MCKVKIQILISLFILIGQVNASEYYPVQIGNKWKYVVHANTDYEIENEVLEKIIIGKVAWYKLRDFNDIFWVRSGKSGQYEAINWFDKQNPEKSLPVETLIFKYPIDKTTVYVAGDDTIIAYYPPRVIGTPAGEFKCIMYQIGTNKDDHSKSCVSYGVGVIWSEVVTNGKSEIAELIEFKLK